MSNIILIIASARLPVTIPLMTKKETSGWGGRRPGSGRPRDGEYPHQVTARVSDEQLQYLQKNFDSIAAGVRAAIDCLMAQDGPPPAIPPG